MAKKGFIEDSIQWMGTREALEAWKQYKREKALRFVERGYSVSWYPDGDGWMDIYLPERPHGGQPEIRASVKFFNEPSRYGIMRGRVSKLTIRELFTDLIAQAAGKPFERIRILFNYDRGPDVNHLDDHLAARPLYDLILQELN